MSEVILAVEDMKAKKLIEVAMPNKEISTERANRFCHI